MNATTLAHYSGPPKITSPLPRPPKSRNLDASHAAVLRLQAGWATRGEVALSKNFASFILIAMVLGIVVGYACHEAFPDPKTAATIAGYISLVTDLFLRLIKMIIAPLVISTLIVGITHMGSGSNLGRVGAKTMGWFVSASLVSLLLGMVMVNILQPGVSHGLPVPD